MKEQIDAIQCVLRKPQFPDYKFTFGQYTGKTLEYVLRMDTNYVQWVLSEDFIKPRVRSKIEQGLKLHEKIR